MAQIATGKIIGTDEYINVETELSVSLTADKLYAVQIQGEAMICESDTQPMDGGIYWNTLQPFGYKKESAYLWVKINKGDEISINFTE